LSSLALPSRSKELPFGVGEKLGVSDLRLKLNSLLIASPKEEVASPCLEAGFLGRTVVEVAGVVLVLLTSKSTHRYQRGRASITGLRLKLRKGMKTGRLIGVAVSRLVRHIFIRRLRICKAYP
jgi:hypothetical protein